MSLAPPPKHIAEAGKPFSVHAEITFKAGSVTDEVLEDLKQLQDGSAAEPGVEQYIVSRDGDNLDKVWIFEHYASPAAMLTHTKAPALTTFSAKYKDIIEKLWLNYASFL